MALTVEFFAMIGREGGHQRAKVLSPKKRERIARKAAKSRWSGLTAEERKAERAKGREPDQRMRSRWDGLNAEQRKIEYAKGRAPKLDNEPATKKMAAKS